jgi:tripeptidyl-peptidase-1
VEGYLTAALAKDKTLARLFNTTNRGYNDATALGNNIPIVFRGRVSLAGAGGGTSASGPIIAGLLARLNGLRMSKGQPSLGFVNPLLYALAGGVPSSGSPGAFIRPRSGGSNRCQSDTDTCCAKGYPETAGQAWSPASGLGSLNYTALASAMLLL